MPVVLGEVQGGERTCLLRGHDRVPRTPRALYGEAAQAGDADAKKVFEPAPSAMTAMGNAGPCLKSRDALIAVTAACAPWAPRS